MKTTLDLPDSLVKEVKFRALHDGRKLDDVIADLLRAGLAPAPKISRRKGSALPKNLPLIKSRSAQPGDARRLSTQEWCDWIREAPIYDCGEGNRLIRDETTKMMEVTE